MPDRRATARAGDTLVRGFHIRPIRQAPYSMSRVPMPIEGEYSLTRCRVGAGELDARCVVDVHHVGRGLRQFHFPPASPATGLLPGLAIPWRGHTFVLREPEKQVHDHLHWAEVGTFSVFGPTTPGSEPWWDVVWPFTLVLGSGVGCPIDVVGWDAYTPDRSAWITSEWRRRGKTHDAGSPGNPVGRLPYDGGAGDVAEWVGAGLAAWDRWGPKLGLEVALLYLENSHGQAESEIRCRDLVNAIERLLVGIRRTQSERGSSQIGQNHSAAERILGRALLTTGKDSELADLSRFRNRLAHDGGLIDERENTLAEQQRIADAEGWLLTCCYRILGAILGTDVPLRDFAARGLPRRRPSGGGFARSTFVPEESA